MNSTIDSFETAHYGNLLQKAGYLTAYFGKYLNPPASKYPPQLVKISTEVSDKWLAFSVEPYCKDGGIPSHPVNSGEFKVHVWPHFGSFWLILTHFWLIPPHFDSCLAYFCKLPFELTVASRLAHLWLLPA